MEARFFLFQINVTSFKDPIIFLFLKITLQKMGFGGCDTAEGRQLLNDFLASNSYIDGSTATQGDDVVFRALEKSAFVSSPVSRWFGFLISS